MTPTGSPMAQECSFDIVSKIDLQEVDNAVQQTMKEIRTRYDFKGSVSEVTRTGNELTIVADDRFRLKSVVEILSQKLDLFGKVLDASDHVPRNLDQEALDWADVAVSTCSEEVCPVTPGVRRISWVFEDPKNLPLERVREIRDDIEKSVEQLLRELDAA